MKKLLKLKLMLVSALGLLALLFLFWFSPYGKLQVISSRIDIDIALFPENLYSKEFVESGRIIYCEISDHDVDRILKSKSFEEVTSVVDGDLRYPYEVKLALEWYPEWCNKLPNNEPLNFLREKKNGSAWSVMVSKNTGQLWIFYEWPDFGGTEPEL